MNRSLEKEMMDLPDQPRELLEEDLRNLRVINRCLGGARNAVRGLSHAVRSHGIENFSLLDIGTGSADIPLAMVAWARRNRLGARIVSVDRDAVTVRVAASLTRPTNLPCAPLWPSGKACPEQSRREGDFRRCRISIVRADAFAPPFAPAAFDFLHASQFLHHFQDAEIVALLRSWSRVARRAIIVSDLVRHPLAYHGIRLLTRLCTRNAMTRTDAPLSVARAFTLAEWRELLRRADIGSFELSMTFPFRMLAVVSLGN